MKAKRSKKTDSINKEKALDKQSPNIGLKTNQSDKSDDSVKPQADFMDNQKTNTSNKQDSNFKNKIKSNKENLEVKIKGNNESHPDNNKEIKSASKENPHKNLSKYQKELPLLRSMVRIRIIGFNQARILNTLNAEFITLKNIYRPGAKVLELTIHKKDSAKTFAILEKMCYNYSVLALSGPRIMLSSLVKHVGFAIGAIVFTVLIALSTQIVWRIEVSGNKATDSQLIIRSLSDCGVKVGGFKTKVDKTAVTQRLRTMQGIAEGTVEVIGTTIVIKVIEEKEYIPPDGDPEIFTDITSLYDAEITRIDVKKGTSNYSVGDRVAADSVLIRGERLNSLGEPLEQVKAEGSVYGIVTFKQKHIFSATEQILTRTGSKKTFTNLSLFGLTIGKKNTTDWQKEVEEYKLFFIPIKVTRTDCYQTKIVEKERDLDAYIESLKDEAVLQNVIKAGGSEISTTTTITPMDGGLYMLNIYIQAEILISEG